MMFQATVYKASLDLGNQSVDEFITSLSEGVRGIYPSRSYVWSHHVYADRVVVCVWDEESPSKYYQHSYSRKLDGGFEFGEAVEVRPVTQFVAV